MQIKRGNEAKTYPLSVNDLAVGEVYESDDNELFVCTDEDTIVNLEVGTMWLTLEDGYAAGLSFRPVNAHLVVED